MKKYDGADIQYLLKKKGYSLSDVARDIHTTPQNVFQTIMGMYTSRPVLRHIETLLGMESGSLEISRKKTASLIKVA